MNEICRPVFPGKQPPFGMEISGGQKHRPSVICPADDNPNNWWPDLYKPITAIVSVRKNGVSANAEAGSYEGSVSPKAADGLVINCSQGEINGLLVDGVEDFVIDGADIRMSGTGKDDFAGIGAGIMVTNDSRAVLKNSRVETYGAGKSALLNTRGSELIVENCDLITHGGLLPDKYEYVVGPGMLEPPRGLAIGGNARTTLTSECSKSCFNDSRIYADGWAVLSTDAALGYDYLEANNCEGHCRGDGYIAYSDGDCHVYINGGTYTSGHWFAILANLAEMYVNNVSSVSEDSSFLIHNVLGYNVEAAELHINGGSFVSKNDFMLLRSTNSYIEMSGVDIQAGNNMFIHVIVNPDEDRTQVNGEVVYGNNIAISNMRPSGDIINEDYERTTAVAFANSTFTGKIVDCYISLDAGSIWNVTGDSRVVIVGNLRLPQINGDEGTVIEAYAGEGCDLAEGEYQLRGGAILKVLR